MEHVTLSEDFETLQHFVLFVSFHDGISCSVEWCAHRRIHLTKLLRALNELVLTKHLDQGLMLSKHSIVSMC